MAVDVLSQLIADAIARQSAVNREPLIYGVWIDGQGWLKNQRGIAFGDSRREVADTAVVLWGDGARVLVIDNRVPPQMDASALEELEPRFLERPRPTRAQRWLKRIGVRSKASR